MNLRFSECGYLSLLLPLLLYVVVCVNIFSLGRSVGQSVHQSVARSVVVFDIVVVLHDFFVVSLVLLLCFPLSHGMTGRPDRCATQAGPRAHWYQPGLVGNNANIFI